MSDTPIGPATHPRFRAMVEHAGFGVWNVAQDGRTLYVNPAMCAMLEVGAEDSPGAHDPASFFSPSDLARIAAVPAGHAAPLHVQIKGACGAARHAICFVTALVAEDGERSFLRSFADVTDLRKQEERSQQASKLEAIGRLAGGIAHDFNNLLMVVYTCCGLIDRQLRTGDAARSYLEQIEAAVKRGSDLTRQVLSFARHDAAVLRAVDVNEVVKNLIGMLNRVIGDEIEVRANIDRSLRPVRADRGQLEQVLMNLALNARDAMPSGGKLVVSTANVELDAQQARDLDVAPGDYVLLAVADTGHGMDEETRARAFEPFFTTKAGKGTGLGLATSFGIVRGGGGAITVDSVQGRGSSFSLWLPVARGERSEATNVRPARAAQPGTETVLLVDDEEAIRRPLAEFLRLHGFTVLEAKNGLDAMEHARRHASDIHVLVTDVVMPRMGGKSLADALLAVRPEMRVLYLTGYSESTIVRRGQIDPGASVLQKPFPPAALVSRIHDLLANAD